MKDVQGAFGVASYVTSVVTLAVMTWQMWSMYVLRHFSLADYKCGICKSPMKASSSSFSILSRYSETDALLDISTCSRLRAIFRMTHTPRST